VQILGISANIPFSQKAFADSLGLPYPLLSDFPDLAVIRRYGGVNPKRGGMLARRAFFLIDRDGIVRGRWLPDPEETFSSEAILKAAEALLPR
jgi:peroxiredoxin